MKHLQRLLWQVQKLPWARLFAYTALLVFGAATLAWLGVFGVANLACDLGDRRVRALIN
jgi:hypothetical protein